MLDEICGSIRNFFTADEDMHFGVFTISGGVISPLDFVPNGAYYRVIGSILNDGVYHKGYDDTELVSETFRGAVWLMRPPVEFLRLAQEITEWQAKNADAVSSPYTMESFGGYTYQKAAGGENAPTWDQIFRTRLNRWRKI